MSEYYVFKNRNDPRYANIQEEVRKNNSLVVNSYSIAGEGVKGIFSGMVLLGFLRLNIINNTYHPHLFHYYVGVSVGAVITMIVLNTCFLYEEVGTEIAIEYIDACIDFFIYDNLKLLFLDIGNGKPFNVFDFDPYIVLNNLYNKGCLCVRDSLERFIEGENIPKFNNKLKYFQSKEYYNWLDGGRLNNVSFVCYSAQETSNIVFTGNPKRFKTGLQFVKYKLLNSHNYIHALLCSSDIPLLYPVENIDGTNYATDGASAEINQSLFIQSLINASYYSSANKMYTPELLFFDIKPINNNDFTITHNKISLQYAYENMLLFPQSSFKFIQSLQNIINTIPRIEYNAKNNVPLVSLFLQQPYVKEFSTLNINEITLTIYNNVTQTNFDNVNIVKTTNYTDRVPLYLVSESEYDNGLYYYNKNYRNFNDYKNEYKKFNVITSNQLISSFIFYLNPPENIILLDMYNSTFDSSDFIFNDVTTSDYVNIIRKLGKIIGDMFYDIAYKQSHTSVSDGSLTEINDNAIKCFLGTKQS